MTSLRSPEILIAGVAMLIAIATLSAAFVSVSSDPRRARAAELRPSPALAFEFDHRFRSEDMRRSRRELALTLLRGRPPTAEDVLAFLDAVGDYSQRGTLDIGTVRDLFGSPIIHYWAAVRGYVAARRAGPVADPSFCEHFEWANRALLRERAQRRQQEVERVAPTAADIQDFLEAEAELTAPADLVGPTPPWARPGTASAR